MRLLKFFNIKHLEEQISRHYVTNNLKKRSLSQTNKKHAVSVLYKMKLFKWLFLIIENRQSVRKTVQIASASKSIGL